MINTGTFRQDKIVFVFLTIFFLATSVLALFSSGTYESGDSIQHYLIAHYSFDHPELFFDNWGKPFFTLLASPFARVGFFGICLFNIICATVTGFIAYKIAQMLCLDAAFLSPVFALFAPIYYVTLISGLTEPLFGLVLMAGIYFTLVQQTILAAIIISFLALTRSEGFLLLPLFALSFLMRRNYLSCLLLLSGTVIYSVTGYFYKHNILWIFTDNPYKGAKDIYGSGDLFHFISKNEFILGTPLVILFVLGIISYFVNLKKNSLVELLLIPGTVLVYLAAHSVFWWKGIYGSVGSIRVMAGVMPPAGIVALRGLNIFLKLFAGFKAPVKKTIVLIVAILVAWMPFKQHHFPRELGYEDETVKEAADWIKKNQPDAKKYYYLYPYLSIFLDIDPYNTEDHIPLYGVQENIPPGSLLIWDSHLCPNEGRLPLTSLTDNKELELLRTFKTDPSKIPGDKQPFEVCVFKKK